MLVGYEATFRLGPNCVENHARTSLSIAVVCFKQLAAFTSGGSYLFEMGGPQMFLFRNIV